ncbi:hypothetical protein ACFXHA_04560 [Nocardia sp. NPDC059240]|uniref:hypothetical protein n=1 Tax=Nocardia sp. NPDC059240 TaxID=3346786 RepID=UPI0036C779D2
MQITEYSVFGLRSAIIELRARGKPLTFRLFPMIHIGKPEFYREVGERLRECDLVVAEGWDMPSSTGMAIMLAMRLTFQRAAWQLVHQDIDYEALGIPTLWPDAQSSHSRRERLDLLSFLDLVLMIPFYVVVMALGGRGWLLRNRFEINDNSEIRMRSRRMTEFAIHDRDADLVSTLSQVYEERHDRREIVAVVYGAAHMPAVINALNARFGYRAVGAEWMTVFDEADLHRMVD